MIFSGSHNGVSHIELIKLGKKTWTRRLLANEKMKTIKVPRYKPGHSYSIQPARTKPGIPDGRILILMNLIECKTDPHDYPISKEHAELEGGYTPEQYEQLFEQMFKGWIYRVAYNIRYIEIRRLI